MSHPLQIIERRRRLRAGAIGVASLLAVGLLLIPGGAVAQDTVAVSAEGWAGRPLPAPTPGELDPVTGGVDDNAPTPEVAANTLPVGLRNGERSHQSYLMFDLPVVEDGATVLDMSLTLTEAGNGAGEPTAVLACLTTEQWPAEPGFNWSDRPAEDLDACEAGQASDDGTWTFNMRFLAREWLERGATNNGITIIPGGAQNLPTGQPSPDTLNYMISFGGVESETPPQVTLSLLSAPEPEETTEPEPVAPPPAQEDTGGSSDSGGSGFAFSAPTFEEAPAPAPAPQPEPEVAPEPPAAPAPQQPVAAPAVSAPVTPAYVWALIPLALILAFMVSRALMAPVMPIDEREGATSRLLERRRREREAGATGLPALQV